MFVTSQISFPTCLHGSLYLTFLCKEQRSRTLHADNVTRKRHALARAPDMGGTHFERSFF